MLTVRVVPLNVTWEFETTVGALTKALVEGIRSISTRVRPLVMRNDGAVGDRQSAAKAIATRHF